MALAGFLLIAQRKLAHGNPKAPEKLKIWNTNYDINRRESPIFRWQNISFVSIRNKNLKFGIEIQWHAWVDLEFLKTYLFKISVNLLLA